MNKTTHAGDVFASNDGSSCVVISAPKGRKALVRFRDKMAHEMWAYKNNLARGELKNPYHPSLCGVGFMGVGRFSSWSDGKLCPVYSRWANMIKRCYGSPDRNKSYDDCSVRGDWHSLQEFGAWVTAQPLWGVERCDVDKDLLIMGNRVYSPDACLLVPARINYLLTRPSISKGLPVGVTSKGGLYEAKCREQDSKYRSLGAFSCPKDAFNVYRQHKLSVIRSVADEYRSRIDPRLYDALMSYEVLP